MSVNLAENDLIVTCLRDAAFHGSTNLSDIPGLLKRVIREDMWRERLVVRTGEIVAFKRFEEFVSTPALEGLGMDYRSLKNLCRDDVEAVDLLDQVTKNGDGAPQGNCNADKTTVDNINSSIEGKRPDGTSEAAALRRLRKDAPEIHARVISGELSAHGGMIKAGFRRKNIQLPCDPQAAARALKRHFNAEELKQIILMLRN